MRLRKQLEADRCVHNEKNNIKKNASYTFFHNVCQTFVLTTTKKRAEFSYIKWAQNDPRSCGVFVLAVVRLRTLRRPPPSEGPQQAGHHRAWR